MMAKSELLKKVLTPAIIGLIGALILLLAFSASPVNGDQLNGRAVIGTVTAVGVDAVTVSTAQLELTLEVDQTPPSPHLETGMPALRILLNIRVAALRFWLTGNW